MTASQALLELRGLQVAYGGIRAVRASTCASIPANWSA